MLSPEELVRRCSHAVAVVTGVDPWEHRNDTHVEDKVQIARKLWVHLLASEFGMSRAEAARMLARRRETIIINLAELEDWRDSELHPRAGRALDEALDAMGAQLRCLMESGAIATSAMPTPIERSRIARARSAR